MSITLSVNVLSPAQAVARRRHAPTRPAMVTQMRSALSLPAAQTRAVSLSCRRAFGPRAVDGRLSASALRARAAPRARAAVTVTAADGMKVLVVGSGGREHALCWKLAQSDRCSQVIAAPGNPGIAKENKLTCLSSSELNVDDQAAVVAYCKANDIGLVVVGPEVPLVAGLGDSLVEAGIPCFGPSKAAAALEGSKAFMKDICKKYGIDTAAYEVFDNAEEAKAYIKTQGAPIVVKADGLAAGKGVIVAMTEQDSEGVVHLQEALDAVDDMLIGGMFGAAGARVVIEEFMSGEEASFFAVIDGDSAVPLVSAQDHKAVGEGDTGPNTGGMGAYTPAPVVTPALQEQIMKEIITPTVEGMKAEGVPFTGVLFAGLMIQDGHPRLLEYNVRFGDPECQTLMMRMESDLLELLLAAVEKRLASHPALQWSDDTALLVVYATEGYPGSYAKGSVIRDVDAANALSNTVVFHAGTDLNERGELVAVGGRVLGVTSRAGSVKAAAAESYKALDMIQWPEGFCRRDIGWRAIAREEQQ